MPVADSEQQRGVRIQFPVQRLAVRLRAEEHRTNTRRLPPGGQTLRPDQDVFRQPGSGKLALQAAAQCFEKRLGYRLSLTQNRWPTGGIRFRRMHSSQPDLVIAVKGIFTSIEQ